MNNKKLMIVLIIFMVIHAVVIGLIVNDNVAMLNEQDQKIETLEDQVHVLQTRLNRHVSK